MKGVNLIPLSLRHARSHRRRIRRWVLGCAAYAAALMMVCALMRGLSSSDCHALHAELASTSRRIDEADRSIASLHAQLVEMQDKSRTAHAIADQPDWSILLSAIAAQVEEDVVLREVRLGAAPGGGSGNRAVADDLSDPRRYQLSIRGVSRSPAGVSKFVTRLEQMQFFDDVKLLRTTRESLLNGPAVGFEIETSFGQSGRGK